MADNNYSLIIQLDERNLDKQLLKIRNDFQKISLVNDKTLSPLLKQITDIQKKLETSGKAFDKGVKRLESLAAKFDKMAKENKQPEINPRSIDKLARAIAQAQNQDSRLLNKLDEIKDAQSEKDDTDDIGDKIDDAVNKGGGIKALKGGLGEVKNSLLPMLGIATGIGALVGLITESSAILQGVFKLFSNAILLIFRPIGDFIGLFLRPLVLMMYPFIAKFYQVIYPFITKFSAEWTKFVNSELAAQIGVALTPLPFHIADAIVKVLKLAKDDGADESATNSQGQTYNEWVQGGESDGNWWDGIVTAGGDIKKFFDDLFTVQEAYGEEMDSQAETANTLIDDIVQGVEDWKAGAALMVTDFTNWIDNGWAGFVADLGTMTTDFSNWAATAWDDFTKDLDTWASTAWDDFTTTLDTWAGGAWTNFTKTLDDWTAGAWTDFMEDLDTGLGAIGKGFLSLFEEGGTISTAIEGAGNWLNDILQIPEAHADTTQPDIRDTTPYGGLITDEPPSGGHATIPQPPGGTHISPSGPPDAIIPDIGPDLSALTEAQRTANEIQARIETLTEGVDTTLTDLTSGIDEQTQDIIDAAESIRDSADVDHTDIVDFWTAKTEEMSSQETQDQQLETEKSIDKATEKSEGHLGEIKNYSKEFVAKAEALGLSVRELMQQQGQSSSSGGSGVQSAPAPTPAGSVATKDGNFWKGKEVNGKIVTNVKTYDNGLVEVFYDDGSMTAHKAAHMGEGANLEFMQANKNTGNAFDINEQLGYRPGDGTAGYTNSMLTQTNDGWKLAFYNNDEGNWKKDHTLDEFKAIYKQAKELGVPEDQLNRLRDAMSHREIEDFRKTAFGADDKHAHKFWWSGYDVYSNENGLLDSFNQYADQYQNAARLTTMSILGNVLNPDNEFASPEKIESKRRAFLKEDQYKKMRELIGGLREYAFKGWDNFILRDTEESRKRMAEIQEAQAAYNEEFFAQKIPGLAEFMELYHSAEGKTNSPGRYVTGKETGGWNWINRNPFKYAQGGLITEPIFGFGQHSGRSYLMGEAGPERITPISNNGNGNQVTINFTMQVTKEVDAHKVVDMVSRRLQEQFRRGF